MKFIRPSTIDGSVIAPSSKSVLQRALFASAIARSSVHIKVDGWCEDSRAARGVIEALGCRVVDEPGGIAVHPGRPAKPIEVYCGESGLCARMAAAIASTFEREIKLNGRGSLLKRPLDMVEEPLRTLGARCESSSGFLPLIIQGPIRGGQVQVNGSTSSQFLSGLLTALPLCEIDSEIRVANLKSKPYVELTIEVLSAFGVRIERDPSYSLFKVRGRQEYRCNEFLVEGDWSAASCLLVAGAVAGRIEVSGLRTDSTQADRAILEVLRDAGAVVEVEPGVVRVKKSRLTAFSFDAEQCPDLFPALVALACSCDGVSRIQGASRLLHKESNRLEALREEFSRLGGVIETSRNEVRIEGRRLRGGQAASHGDHRIAMACAAAGLVSEEGVEITGEESVAKSYPRFFDDLERVTSLNEEP